MTRILLMDGNTCARQRTVLDLGARHAGLTYLETLQRHFPEIDFDRVDAAEPGNVLPLGTSLNDYQALVIGGSSMHAYEEIPEVQRQVEMLRAFAETGRPIFGSCWGLQIAAVAAGGNVRACRNGGEVVVARKLMLSDAGRRHSIYADKPPVFDAPCIHFDEIESLPSGAELLCSNSHSEVQAAIIPLGKSTVTGVQYHPEFDLRHLYDTVRMYGEMLIDQGFFADDAARLGYEGHLERLADNPEDVALQWQLGIDADVVDDDVRSREITNWVRYFVLPNA